MGPGGVDTAKPHCPWTNEKVERFIRTPQIDWAYKQPFTNDTERRAALAHWLMEYDEHRPRRALPREANDLRHAQARLTPGTAARW